MTLTNAGRAPLPRTPPAAPRRADYVGLCRCGTELSVSLAVSAQPPVHTPIGPVEWTGMDLERDGLPKAVSIDHTGCEKPPSRIARDRGRPVLR